MRAVFLLLLVILLGGCVGSQRHLSGAEATKWECLKRTGSSSCDNASASTQANGPAQTEYKLSEADELKCLKSTGNSTCSTNKSVALEGARAKPTKKRRSLWDSIALINPFDTTEQDFQKLVDVGNYKGALDFFNKNYSGYFELVYAEGSKSVSPEILKVGKWYFDEIYKESDISDALIKMKAIVLLEENTNDLWLRTNWVLSYYSDFKDTINRTAILSLSGVGDDALATMSKEVERIRVASIRDRQVALASTFEQTFRTGARIRSYPISPFTLRDYIDSQVFQQKIIDSYRHATKSERLELVKRLHLLSSLETDNKFIEIQKNEAMNRALAKLGKRPFALEKLGQIKDLIKEFGPASGLENAVKIGYVDLTASSFKDRNIFDFTLAFERDYGIKLEDAKATFIGQGKLGSYDFIFVTDLSAAKIYREFKNKRSQSSETQTGTRQEQNPDYLIASSNYQSALANLQRARVKGSEPCYGSGLACGITAVLHAAIIVSSKNKVEEQMGVFSSTPQTLTKPVYTPYNYELVDVSTTKVARVNYYVIDVHKKRILSSNFDIKDHESFTVSYNVEQNDPSRSRILSYNKTEETVTDWEEEPIRVKLSDLFDSANLNKGKKKRFVNVASFLKPLSSRKYVSAKPAYSRSERGRGVTNVVNGTIADERFDSVVMVKRSNGLGAGFYVTPDLILTAYHVVDGASLVEMVFYDGSKTFGKVVDHDVRLDLALIRPQVTGKPVKIYTGPIRLGETVEAIGHPKGYEFTITRGVVSAMRKQAGVILRSSAPVEFVQTDTPISPGNSGGPLFIGHSVVGVNDWVRVDKASQNLNFSVSYNEIREYLNRFERSNR